MKVRQPCREAYLMRLYRYCQENVDSYMYLYQSFHNEGTAFTYSVYISLATYKIKVDRKVAWKDNFLFFCVLLSFYVVDRAWLKNLCKFIWKLFFYFEWSNCIIGCLSRELNKVGDIYAYKNIYLKLQIFTLYYN